jgi:hypothetical protein
MLVKFRNLYNMLYIKTKGHFQIRVSQLPFHMIVFLFPVSSDDNSTMMNFTNPHKNQQSSVKMETNVSSM